MDPTQDLVVAALAKLKATPAVTALVGQKIYDRPPERQTANGSGLDLDPPYISCDYTDVAPDDAVCVTGETIIFQMDAWSWGGGEAYSSAQVRKIAWAVRQALHNADLPLSVNTLVTIEHDRTRIQRAGVTNHAAIRFVASVETP